MPPPQGDELPDRRESPYQQGEVVEGQPVHGEVVRRSVTFRQAPYPSPGELEAYERIHPGFTDRILSLTERETSHRIERERNQDRDTTKLAARGQIFAFVIVMALVAGAIVAILTDHSVIGLASIVTAAAALAAAFLTRGGARSDTPDDPERLA